jgi:Uma2 family endonuclease
MATQTIPEPLVTVEEYLATDYEPDCEYNDGVLDERNLGEFDHSYLQGLLTTLFTNQMKFWRAFALPEQRVRLGPRRFLIPDVAVLRLDAKREAILTQPPLITIEIMSPKDRLRSAALKSLEYLEFGVENIWVIDPNERMAYCGTETGLERVESQVLRVDATPIQVDVRELFEQLDRMWAAPTTEA